MKTPSSVEVWLWLLLVMNPYNPKTTKLLAEYDSAEALCCDMRDGKCGNLSEAEKQRVKNTRTREVRQLMEECAANSIRIVTLDDPEYPYLLKNIFDPPIVLFVRGTLACFNGAVPLAVVGPRRPSQTAVSAARYLCSDLVNKGTLILSGLAVGIDTIAHTCAVSSRYPTVGVLACGHLVNYPAESEDLRKQIVEFGGAVVSELLPHATVTGRYFHRRNRIISGMGLGTLLVEASTRSGCLITANHTIEQGRDLFCVPPSDITRESCAGVISYLRDGAVPVFDYLDIVRSYMLEYFGEDYSGESDEELCVKTPITKFGVHTRNQKAIIPAATAEQTQRPDNSPAPSPKKAKKTAPKSLEGLTELQQKLMHLIENQAQTADELIAQTGIPYAEAVEALTELEIMGHITLLPEGKYEINA